MAKSKDTKTTQVWGKRMKEGPSSLNILYCSGRDVVARPPADEILIPYDIWLNRSHVIMLAKQRLINKKTARDILSALKEIANEFIQGKFKLDPMLEDVHINIEKYVAAKVGEEIAGKMHTGKSRNDQTTTDIRLFIRDKMLEFYDNVVELIDTILDAAERSTDVVMPGFTHGQPASITTLGHWFASHAQAFFRDLDRIQTAYSHINISPLGAAAAFGTSWNINRSFTAQLLGFDGIQENSLDCITSRWEPEAETLSAISFFMTHLSVLAQDIFVFSDLFKGFFIINDKFVTGSSIMPQKRNPDFVEVTRAKTAWIHSALNNIYGIAKSSLSGYNRDTQWTKYIILDAFEEVQYAPVIFKQVISTLSIDIKKMKAAAESYFMNSVDVADFIAQKTGLPFRITYQIISESVKTCEEKGRLDLESVNNALKKHEINLKINKTEWISISDPKGIALRKLSQGSPNPQHVIMSISNMREDIERRKKFSQLKKDTLDTARELIHKECQDITA